MSMSIKSLTVAGVILIAAGGCTSVNNEKAFGKTITDASTSFTSSLSYAQKVQFEYQLTRASKAFLMKTPDPSKFTADCSTDVDREIKIAQNRILKFKIIETYFKQMEDEINNNIDFVKYTSEIDNLSAAIKSIPIAGFSVDAEITAIKAIAVPLAGIGNKAQTYIDLKRIRDRAKKIAEPLRLIVADLSSGLVSSQDTLNAAVKTWEVCEQERLEVIYSHVNANPAEISTLFEAFQVKLATLKTQNKIVISSQDALNGVIAANKKLADPNLTFENAKVYVKDGTESAKYFKSLIDEIGKL